MKILATVTLPLFFAVIALGQQAPQSSDIQAPSGKATGQAARARTMGDIEVLTDTQGVDFGPFLHAMLQAVRDNWYALIPAEANAPELKSGTLVIEFRILGDGRVTGMKIVSSSGDIALDRAAWGGITASNPFVPLPAEFTGPYLALRFRFRYNPKKGERVGNDAGTRIESHDSKP